MALIPPILFAAAIAFVVPFSWLLAINLIKKLFR